MTNKQLTALANKPKTTVLALSCTHAPAMLETFPRFIRQMIQKHKPTHIVHLGDVMDFHALSYHERVEGTDTPEIELNRARRQVQQLARAFGDIPTVWMIGNHDAIPLRKARDLDMPLTLMSSYRDIAGVDWHVIPRYEDLIISGVVYRHGDKAKGGQFAAFANAKDEHRSVVQGHFHAQSGVQFMANGSRRIFGMQVGSGMDHKALAATYGKKFSAKPIIGAGIIKNGVEPIIEVMPL